MSQIPLHGSKRSRKYARTLKYVLIHPSGIFQVFGKRATHTVTVKPNKEATQFMYRCSDCKHSDCSHVLAIMGVLEPNLIRIGADSKKRQ